MKTLLLLVLAQTQWTFDDGKPNRPPAQFEFGASQKAPAARWVVKRDGKGLVLAQIERKAKQRLAVAVVRDSSFQAVRLSAKVKAVAGYQAAGVVWAYKDPEHYLVARTNPAEGNVRVDRVVGGSRTKLKSAPVDGLEKGKWHTLRIEHRGTTIALYLGDEKVFDIPDAPPAEAGKVGLWVKDDTVAHFDDFAAESLAP